MEPNQIVMIRRQEVEQEIARLRHLIDKYEVELSELAVAERVLSRLSGASESKATSLDTQISSTAEAGPSVVPSLTMPEMILGVLGEHFEQHPNSLGLEPKQILVLISKKYSIAPRGDAVGPICWRMWKRGQLDKSGPDYRLPLEEKPADLLSHDGEQAAGSFEPSAGR